MKKLELFFTSLIISVIVLTFIVNHEYTHVYFFEEHGCESKIDFQPDLSQDYIMATYSDCPDKMSIEEYRQINLKQGMVEAVGYQLFIILITILGVWKLLEAKMYRNKKEILDSIDQVEGDITFVEKK